MNASRIIAPPVIVLLMLTAACRPGRRVTHSFDELKADSAAFSAGHLSTELYDSLVARLDIELDSVEMVWPDGRRLTARRASASAAREHTLRSYSDSTASAAVSASRSRKADIKEETPQPRGNALRRTLVALLLLAAAIFFLRYVRRVRHI